MGLSHLFLLLPVICIIFLPIILWGYGFSILYTKEFHRTRFFIGLITGWCITAGISVSGFIIDISWYLIFPVWLLFLLIFSFLITACMSLISHKKDLLPTKYQFRYFFSHSLFFAFSIGFMTLYPESYFIGSLFGSFFGYMITAGLEESAKHIGYISTDTSSYESKRWMLMMTFFIVLGFAFIENIMYLFQFIESEDIGLFLRSWMMRSLFSLIAHVFVSFLLTYAWWKALSYPFFTFRYGAFFLIGSILAIGWHALYNTLIDSGNIFAILIFVSVALFVTSRMMWKEEK